MRENYWTRQGLRFTRRRFIAGSGVLAAGSAALLAGCGDDDDRPPATASATQKAAPSSSPTVSPTPAATQAAGPRPTNGSYFASYSSMTGTTLDYHRELYRSAAYIQGMAYNQLVVWKDVDKGVVAPDVAKALPEQPDATTFVFTIRDDVKWQNKAPANGRALTMDDVKWNIERQRAQKLKNGQQATNFYRYSTSYAAIDQVQYSDATHLTIKLKQPDASFLGDMSDEFNGIGYKEVFEAIEDDFGTFDPKYVVGTGPYVFDQYDPQKIAHAVRNPDYFRKKTGDEVQFFDQLYFYNLGPDINSQRIAFEQKQIDIINAGKDAIEAIQSAHKDAKQLQVANPEASLMLQYDTKVNAIFSNPKLRQAVHIAMDRALIGQQAFDGLARPNPPIPWAFADWAIPQTELQGMPGFRANKDEDIKEARQLWEAGGGNAVDAAAGELISGNAGATSTALAEWFPAMLNKNLGTNKFSVKLVPTATLLQLLAGGPPIGYVGGYGQWTSPDPRKRFAAPRRKGSSQNFWKYENADFEAKMDQASREYDRTKAIAIMRDIQKSMLQEAGGPHMELAGPLAVWLYWPYLHREGPTFIRYEKQVAGRSWIDQTDPSFAGRKA